MDGRWLEVGVVVEEAEVDDVRAVMTRWAGTAVAVEQQVDASELDDFAPGDQCRVVAYLRDGAEMAVTKYELFNALWMLGAGGSEGLRRPSERWTDETEWLERWKRFYRPLLIGRVGIVPAWDRTEVDGAEVVETMDPGPAFGTGLHVSTRQALLAVQRYGVEGKRFLDVGTGSGILAIAAALLGATVVVGLDTDERAVDTARKNAADNRQEERIEFGVGTLGDEAVAGLLGEPFELVVANIIAGVHADLADRYPELVAGGGHLFLGGILDERANIVLEAMAETGLELIERIDEERWVGLVYKRKE